MLRKLSLLSFFITILLFVVSPAAAQIILPDPPPCCGVFTDPDWLKIDYQRVRVNIENQIATTNIDMQFTNEGTALAEGTFLFPLPEGATVDQLIMYIDGEAIEARVLPADEARQIYDEIVRQYRDPALLEFVGTSAIQANVFPIPPGDFRRIEITYAQVLEVDNGLINYTYPINSSRTVSGRIIEQMSVSVHVEGNDEIGNVYSPSHEIAIVRQDDNLGFDAGFEALDFRPDGDFSMFYALVNNEININLLTYRESANSDGFFMLLVQPPVSVPDEQILPKDVIVVLDQSGSMQGDKWDQARAAATYVLENLNEEDRFNVIMFSTGVRIYSDQMENVGIVPEAVDWIDEQFANGGTDINLALTNALEMANPDRNTTVIFLTDGLATEGIIDTADILDNVGEIEQENVRIFTFGVGNNIDTFLLDSIVRDFNGAGSYVRTGERIDEEVASLFNKISAPVLTNIALDLGNVTTDWVYPTQLSDLFAGEQLTIVGRYRDGAENINITLTGEVNGESQTFVYSNLEFRNRAGGESFIARLWATRRIADMLNSIRLNGENPELVDSIVDLSVRYGIITPYTSFLIEENDILTQQGRNRAAEAFAEEAESLAGTVSGEDAVAASDGIGGMSNASAPMSQSTQEGYFSNDEARDDDGAGGGEFVPQNALVNVNDKTFVYQNGIWTDTTFQPDNMETTQIVFLSDTYFDLLTEMPDLADYFSVGENVIVVIDGTAYEVISE
ncbi:MAG: VIT domain-containing protein [Aggregatilineales bacterium]